jgi:hypothetical protein
MWSGRTGERAVRPKLTRAEAIVLCVTLAAVLVLLSQSPTIWRQHNSCALCRMARNDYSGLGCRWSAYEETECSAWFVANIERHHEHAWARSPSRQMRNIFGTPVGVADSDRPAGFMRLTPTQQIEVYRHVPRAEDAKRLFLDMRDEMESGDNERYRRVHNASSILRDWVKSGFRRPWNEVQTEFAAE